MAEPQQTQVPTACQPAPACEETPGGPQLGSQPQHPTAGLCFPRGKRLGTPQLPAQPPATSLAVPHGGGVRVGISGDWLGMAGHRGLNWGACKQGEGRRADSTLLFLEHQLQNPKSERESTG